MCRLLRHNLEEAKHVIVSDAGPVAAFAEETSPEIMDRIFEEFNSLSVVYRRPASSFVKVDCGSHCNLPLHIVLSQPHYSTRSTPNTAGAPLNC